MTQQQFLQLVSSSDSIAKKENIKRRRGLHHNRGSSKRIRGRQDIFITAPPSLSLSSQSLPLSSPSRSLNLSSLSLPLSLLLLHCFVPSPVAFLLVARFFWKKKRKGGKKKKKKKKKK